MDATTLGRCETSYVTATPLTVRTARFSCSVARPHFTRGLGWLFDPDSFQGLSLFPNDFPAVVVLDHTTPTTPTPTGVRMMP